MRELILPLAHKQRGFDHSLTKQGGGGCSRDPRFFASAASKVTASSIRSVLCHHHRDVSNEVRLAGRGNHTSPAPRKPDVRDGRSIALEHNF
jgi:hypothetical protein